MKLVKREFEGKNGKGFAYDLKKINDEGIGMIVGDKVAIKLSFDPSFETKSTMRDGKEVSFEVGKFLGEPLQPFENYEGNEKFNNAYFNLAGKIVSKVRDTGAVAGDVLVFEFKKFEVEEDGKTKVIKYLDVKKQGEGQQSLNDSAQPTSNTDGSSDFVKSLVADFIAKPSVFNQDYFQTSLKDGVTAPWAFIDEFNKAAAEEGETYTQEEVLKIYNDIVQATQSSRT